MKASQLVGSIVDYPTPNRPGYWASRLMPNQSLLEIELTREEWHRLHEEAVALDNKRIRKLNEHPLNQAALHLLKTAGTGSFQSGALAQIHLLSLAQLAIADAVSEDDLAWQRIAECAHSVESMRAAVSRLAEEFEAEELMTMQPREAAHLILSVLEVG